MSEILDNLVQGLVGGEGISDLLTNTEKHLKAIASLERSPAAINQEMKTQLATQVLKDFHSLPLPTEIFTYWVGVLIDAGTLGPKQSSCLENWAEEKGYLEFGVIIRELAIRGEKENTKKNTLLANLGNYSVEMLNDPVFALTTLDRIQQDGVFDSNLLELRFSLLATLGRYKKISETLLGMHERGQGPDLVTKWLVKVLEKIAGQPRYFSIVRKLERGFATGELPSVELPTELQSKLEYAKVSERGWKERLLELYEKANRAESHDAYSAGKYWSQVAELQFAFGRDLEAALTTIRKAIRLAPEYGAAIELTSSIYEASGQYSVLVSHLEELSREYDSEVSKAEILWRCYEILLIDLKNEAGAYRLLRSLNKANTSHRACSLHLTSYYLRHGQIAEAATCLGNVLTAVVDVETREGAFFGIWAISRSEGVDFSDFADALPNLFNENPQYGYFAALEGFYRDSQNHKAWTELLFVGLQRFESPIQRKLVALKLMAACERQGEDAELKYTAYLAQVEEGISTEDLAAFVKVALEVGKGENSITRLLKALPIWKDELEQKRLLTAILDISMGSGFVAEPSRRACDLMFALDGHAGEAKVTDYYVMCAKVENDFSSWANQKLGEVKTEPQKRSLLKALLTISNREDEESHKQLLLRLLRSGGAFEEALLPLLELSVRMDQLNDFEGLVDESVERNYITCSNEEFYLKIAQGLERHGASEQIILKYCDRAANVAGVNAELALLMEGLSELKNRLDLVEKVSIYLRDNDEAERMIRLIRGSIYYHGISTFPLQLLELLVEVELQKEVYSIDTVEWLEERLGGSDNFERTLKFLIAEAKERPLARIVHDKLRSIAAKLTDPRQIFLCLEEEVTVASRLDSGGRYWNSVVDYCLFGFGEQGVWPPILWTLDSYLEKNEPERVSQELYDLFDARDDMNDDLLIHLTSSISTSASNIDYRIEFSLSCYSRATENVAYLDDAILNIKRHSSVKTQYFWWEKIADFELPSEHAYEVLLSLALASPDESRDMKERHLYRALGHKPNGYVAYIELTSLLVQNRSYDDLVSLAQKEKTHCFDSWVERSLYYFESIELTNKSLPCLGEVLNDCIGHGNIGALDFQRVELILRGQIENHQDYALFETVFESYLASSRERMGLEVLVQLVDSMESAAREQWLFRGWERCGTKEELEEIRVWCALQWLLLFERYSEPLVEDIYTLGKKPNYRNDVCLTFGRLSNVPTRKLRERETFALYGAELHLMSGQAESALRILDGEKREALSSKKRLKSILTHTMDDKLHPDDFYEYAASYVTLAFLASENREDMSSNFVERIAREERFKTLLAPLKYSLLEDYVANGGTASHIGIEYLNVLKDRQEWKIISAWGRERNLDDYSYEQRIRILLILVEAAQWLGTIESEEECLEHLLSIAPENTSVADEFMLFMESGLIHEKVLSYLERYLCKEGRIDEYKRVLIRKYELTEEPSAKLLILKEIAELASKLGEAEFFSRVALEALELSEYEPSSRSWLFEHAKQGCLAQSLCVEIERCLLGKSGRVRRELRWLSADIYDEILQLPEASVEELEKLRQEEGNDLYTLERLELRYRSLDAPRELALVLERKLEFVVTQASKLNILKEIFAICFEKTNDFDGAREALWSIYWERSEDSTYFDTLENLLVRQERWANLVSIYEEERIRLGLFSGEVSEERFLKPNLRLIETYLFKLGDRKRAFGIIADLPLDGESGRGIFEILTREPRPYYVDTLSWLVQYYEVTGNQQKRINSLNDLIVSTESCRRKAHWMSALSDIYLIDKEELSLGFDYCIRAWATEPTNLKFIRRGIRFAREVDCFEPLLGALEGNEAIVVVLEETELEIIFQLFEIALEIKTNFEVIKVALKRLEGAQLTPRISHLLCDWYLKNENLNSWLDLKRELIRLEPDVQKAALLGVEIVERISGDDSLEAIAQPFLSQWLVKNPIERSILDFCVSVLQVAKNWSELFELYTGWFRVNDNRQDSECLGEFVELLLQYEKDWSILIQLLVEYSTSLPVASLISLSESIGERFGRTESFDYLMHILGDSRVSYDLKLELGRRLTATLMVDPFLRERLDEVSVLFEMNLRGEIETRILKGEYLYYEGKLSDWVSFTQSFFIQADWAIREIVIGRVVRHWNAWAPELVEGDNLDFCITEKLPEDILQRLFDGWSLQEVSAVAGRFWERFLLVNNPSSLLVRGSSHQRIKIGTSFFLAGLVSEPVVVILEGLLDDGDLHADAFHILRAYYHDSKSWERLTGAVEKVLVHLSRDDRNHLLLEILPFLYSEMTCLQVAERWSLLILDGSKNITFENAKLMLDIGLAGESGRLIADKLRVACATLDDPKLAAELMQLLGMFYFEHLNAYEQAETCLLNAIGKDSFPKEVVDGLVAIAERQHRFDKIVGVLKGYIKSLSETDEFYFDTCFSLGKVWAYDIGDPHRAREVFEKLSTLQPNNVSVQVELFRVSLGGKDWAALKKSGLQLVVSDVGYDILNEVVGALLDLDDHFIDEEVAHLEEAFRRLALGTIDDFLWGGIVGFLSKHERFESLYDLYLQRALAVDNKGIRCELWLSAAEISEQFLGSQYDAITCLERVLEQEARSEKAFVSLEGILSAQCEWEKLIDVLYRYMAAVDELELKAGILVKIGKIYHQSLGRGDLAEKAFQEARNLEPDSVQALAALGRLYERSGNWFQALSMLEQQAELEKENASKAKVFVRIGQIYLEMLLDETSAVRYLRQALVWDNASVESLDMLKSIAEKNENWGDFLQYISRIRGLLEDPEDEYEVLLEIGDHFASRFGDLAKAKHYYSEAIALVLENSDARWKRTQCMLEQEEWGDACNELGELLETDWNDASASQRELWRQEKIRCLEKLGEYSDAVTELRHGIAVNNNNFFYWETLARCLYKLGNYQEACDALEAFLERGAREIPNTETLNLCVTIGSLHLEQGRSQNAQRILCKAYELESEDYQVIKLYEEACRQELEWDVVAKLAMIRLEMASGEERNDAAHKLMESFENKGVSFNEISVHLNDFEESGECAESVFVRHARLAKEEALIEESVLILDSARNFRNDTTVQFGAELELSRLLRNQFGNEVDAFSILEEALVSRPNNPAILDEFEKFVEKTGRWESLERIYGLVLSTSEPEQEINRIVRQSLAELEAHVFGRIGNAIEHYETLNRVQGLDAVGRSRLFELYMNKGVEAGSALKVHIEALPSGDLLDQNLRQLAMAARQVGARNVLFDALDSLRALGEATSEELVEVKAMSSASSEGVGLVEAQSRQILPVHLERVSHVLRQLYLTGGGMFWDRGLSVGNVFGEVVRIRRGPLYSVLKDLVKGTSFEGTQLWMKRGGMDAPTVLMNEEQVVLIGSEHPFNQGAEIEALRFGLSRELMYLRPDSILLKKFSSQSLLGILTALWVALGGSEEADAWPRESLESWVVAFRKLGAEEREKLRGSLESVRLVLEYPDRLSEYADWLEKAAGRAAYLCCGSRGAATHSIEMGMETTNGLPIHTLKRDLVLYSMLPDHK